MCSILRNIDFILSLMRLTVGFKQVSRGGESMVSQARLPRPNPGSLTWHFVHLERNILPFCVSVSSSIECR